MVKLKASIAATSVSEGIEAFFGVFVRFVEIAAQDGCLLSYHFVHLAPRYRLTIYVMPWRHGLPPHSRDELRHTWEKCFTERS